MDTILCVCIELVASRIIYSNVSTDDLKSISHQYLRCSQNEIVNHLSPPVSHFFGGLHSYYGTVLLDENKSSVTSAVHDTY